MEIKIYSAQALTPEIALFDRAATDGREDWPADSYFLGLLRDYCGPRRPGYETTGAIYTGEILAEIPASVADVLSLWPSIEENPDEAKNFALSDVITAAGVLGVCRTYSAGPVCLEDMPVKIEFTEIIPF